MAMIMVGVVFKDITSCQPSAVVLSTKVRREERRETTKVKKEDDYGDEEEADDKEDTGRGRGEAGMEGE